MYHACLLLHLWGRLPARNAFDPRPVRCKQHVRRTTSFHWQPKWWCDLLFRVTLQKYAGSYISHNAAQSFKLHPPVCNGGTVVFTHRLTLPKASKFTLTGKKKKGGWPLISRWRLLVVSLVSIVSPVGPWTLYWMRWFNSWLTRCWRHPVERNKAETRQWDTFITSIHSSSLIFI